MSEDQKVKYKTTRLLTRPTISMKAEGAECFIKVQGKMHQGKPMKEKFKEGEKAKPPAILIDVINLVTGEEAQLVVPAVLHSVFDDDYKNDAYVGKSFHILNKGKKETQSGGGQRYNQLVIEEIEPEVSAKK